MKRVWLLMILTIIAILLYSVYPTKSFADVQNSYYVVLKPGIYLPQYKHNKLLFSLPGVFREEFEDEKFENGFSLEVAVGKYVNKNFGGELGIGYFQTKNFILTIDDVTGNVTDSTAFREQVFNISYSIKGYIPLNVLELYGGGGLGVYISNAKVHPTHEVNTNIGLHLLIGGNYNISNDLFVGLEGKYLWSNASFQSGTLTKDIEFDGLLISVNAGKRF